MSEERSEPDYLHPDGKPANPASPDELTDDEKYSDRSKLKALHEADGHSIERRDEFLGNDGKQKREA